MSVPAVTLGVLIPAYVSRSTPESVALSTGVNCLRLCDGVVLAPAGLDPAGLDSTDSELSHCFFLMSAATLTGLGKFSFLLGLENHHEKRSRFFRKKVKMTSRMTRQRANSYNFSGKV